uniref:Alpha-macroglobulin receptor-binding domain-containing protein n=1 Tax=Falco tinnunculus TaxID=100819 RepID=A0A8C4TNQ8_FALTI
MHSCLLLFPPLSTPEIALPFLHPCVGDLMGMALQNLDRLVQIPHGCGEQNMVLFAPIVYVLQYLEKTKQLSPEIKERATGFLRNGYQMQLLYRHRDGSYSVFGQQDGEGNTWLTAFVVKSFGQARKYIYVDDKNVQDALRWLEQNQLPSGCFATKGSIFHSSLKGSVDDEISLGAYVAAALLELGQPLKVSMLPLPPALLSPESTLGFIYCEPPMSSSDSLHAPFPSAGGQIHWSPKPSSPASMGFWPGSQAVDIELTAYVLLAYLSKPRVHASDMATAAGIVAWLTRQQNAYGGFASTQDTVVALQALAKYAARTFSASGQALVRVKSQRGFGKTFQVNRQKGLLVQQAALTEVPGQFLVQVHGSSCVLAQTVLRYHEPPPRAAVTFTLRVNTELTNCSQWIRDLVQENIQVRGAEDAMTSFFPSLLISFHPPKLSDESQTFILQLEQVIQMKNLKPASIKVYDYYQPGGLQIPSYSGVGSWKGYGLLVVA